MQIQSVLPWKKMNCSINGEFLFENLNLNHVIISKKNILFFIIKCFGTHHPDLTYTIFIFVRSVS